MLKFEDKHSLSLSQETTKACPSLKTKTYLLIKVKWIYMPSLFSFDLVHGRSILCLLIFLAISLCLHLWCEASFKSTKTYFIVCLLEKSFFNLWAVTWEGKGWQKIVTNGHKGEKAQKMQFLQWRQFWITPKQVHCRQIPCSKSTIWRSMEVIRVILLLF